MDLTCGTTLAASLRELTDAGSCASRRPVRRVAGAALALGLASCVLLGGREPALAAPTQREKKLEEYKDKRDEVDKTIADLIVRQGKFPAGSDEWKEAQGLIDGLRNSQLKRDYDAYEAATALEESLEGRPLAEQWAALTDSGLTPPLLTRAQIEALERLPWARRVELGRRRLRRRRNSLFHRLGTPNAAGTPTERVNRILNDARDFMGRTAPVIPHKKPPAKARPPKDDAGKKKSARELRKALEDKIAKAKKLQGEGTDVAAAKLALVKMLRGLRAEDPLAPPQRRAILRAYSSLGSAPTGTVFRRLEGELTAIQAAGAKKKGKTPK